MTSMSTRFGAELIGSEPWTRSRHDVRAREASAVWVSLLEARKCLLLNASPGTPVDRRERASRSYTARRGGRPDPTCSVDRILALCTGAWA